MYDKLKILYIEDSENDAVLLTHHLRNLCENIKFERVESKSELNNILKKEKWDVIVIDNSLPTLTALEAIELIKKKNIDSPMICVSGTELQDIRNQCLEAGAKAFILKDNSDEFVKTVEEILKHCFD